MFNRKPAAPATERRLASQLEPDTKLVGDLSFSGLIQIKGNVYGNVIAAAEEDATLLIEEGASITGEVRAPYIQIRGGKVTGNVYSTARISVKDRSTVIGDIHYQEIELDQGAHLTGRLVSMEQAFEEGFL